MDMILKGLLEGLHFGAKLGLIDPEPPNFSRLNCVL